MIRTLLKKAHLFRCARITHSNVLPEYACAREFIARLASGRFLTRLQERAFRQPLGEMLFVWCVAVMLSGCAAVVATDGEIASAENPETSFASCPYLRTQQASCDVLKRAYDEGFRAGKEMIAAEFRTRSELNQPYVWQPPMISEIDMPARVVNGIMIPAHRELVIVKPGYWVRTENVLLDQEFHERRKP
jgi:hypothetical protein